MSRCSPTTAGSTSAKPVVDAIVAGFAGVAYVAITGSRFVFRPA